MRELTYTVYALTDPRDNDIRYIGITYDPDRRLKEHLSSSDSNVLKGKWANELRQLGLTPRMQLLEKRAIPKA
jgi:predicted GIY-YIG superfamily endonuclease